MTDDLYYHTWTSGTTATTSNWATIRIDPYAPTNGIYWIDPVNGMRWIGEDISEPEPIDPDLLMDEGL